MSETLRAWFSSELFMPHGHCYLWKPSLVWLQVLSNSGIGLAYIAIFSTLVYLVRRIRDIPFQWMYLCFAVFIVTCGITHFFDVYVIWSPAYWLDGGVRAVTAVASVGTAVLLPPLVPKAIALAEAAAVSHERGIALERANRELGTLLDRTKELEQLKTQFFANVSHELRTPIALILGPVEKLLAADETSPSARRDLEVVARNARMLQKHVNDLLDVARLEAGRVELHYEHADLSALVRKVAGHFDGLAQERAITYVVETPTSLTAEVDTDKLERALLNLLSNAYKFTPEGGRIRCSMRVDGGADRLILEVADSGPGVRPEHRTLVFDRFRQVDGGVTRQFGGTGLGLAIAKDFVTLHGGTIGVDEAPEGGARFFVELPRKAPPGAQVQTRRLANVEDSAAARPVLEELRPSVDPRAPLPQGERPLVLVVEDNPDMNRFIREVLEADYRVANALDGLEGLETADAVRPDLIISDVMMPKLSGDDLVREIRARPQLENVPIMLLTAKADDDLRVRILRDGAQDYLTKPFSTEELRARAKNLIATKRARDILQREVTSRARDLEALACDLAGQKRALQNALDAMRVAREHAERASELKSSFLSMVSHEFRTPVAAVQLQLERLRREAPSMTASQRNVVQRMTAAMARLSGMIESLLQHAKIQSGRLTLDVRRVDVRSLTHEVVDEVRPRAEQKQLQLTFRSPPSLREIRTDPTLVRLVIANLLENALKYTDQGGVEVAVLPEGDGCRVAVQDTGSGIAPEDQARIFEPFTQLEQIREKHLPGVGLGLALVKEMVQALGGHVELSSEPGVGSRFSVVLPHAAVQSVAVQE